MLQAIGRNMELSEVEASIKQIKRENNRDDEDFDEEDEEENELDLNEFIAFISKEMLENDVKEELVEAYRKFSGSDDPNNGFTRQQLQDTMIQYGEKRLSDEEFDMLF